MKIAIIGASSDLLAVLKARLLKKGVELVDISDDDATIVDAGWLSDIAIPKTLEACDIDNCKDYYADENSNQWRGGSRGKGGKIKYARK